MSYPKLHDTGSGVIARIADDVPETRERDTEIEALRELCEILQQELNGVVASVRVKRVDDCFACWIQHVAETAKYGTREGALKAMCETLHGKLVESRRVPFVPIGPCTCQGWGLPTGCPGCGCYCMGG